MVAKLFTASYWAMDGWGAYIWPAYGITLALLIGLTVRILLRNQAVRRELTQAEARRAQIKTKQGETKK
ncbi:MAG: heme exporter protein CcmD [Neomegalonema sp.]|nr:heme exporter protein CcmD [Neomegalonema sp.]